MPQDGDLAKAFRRAEQRLRRLLLGDGMTEPGMVKGEDARMQVTAALRQLRETFAQALAEGSEPAEARATQLPEELQRRAARAAVRDDDPIGEDRLLTAVEAAEALGLSVSSVYRAVKSGRIEAVRSHGGNLRVPATELDRIRSGAE